MSDFQWGLFTIGIAVIIAVLAYNKWQELKFRRESEANLKSRHDDVLLRSSAQDMLEPPAHAGRVEPEFWPDGLEPGAASIRGSGGKRARQSPATPLSEAIDFIVSLETGKEIFGGALLESAKLELGHLAKPIGLEGLVEGGWEMLRYEGRYTRMRAGMQLVDRQGTIVQLDLAAFSAAVSKAADAAGASAVPGDQGAALQTAAQLDRFCGEVDIQIAVHVVSVDGPFAGTRIRALCEAAGLALENDGRFRRRDGQGLELFSLANEENDPFSSEAMSTLSSSSLILVLDVPRAPGVSRAFAQLGEFAQQLATELGGALVDDNRKALGAAALDSIAVQLEPVYQAMDARGIPAGSPLALRLFS